MFRADRKGEQSEKAIYSDKLITNTAIEDAVGCPSNSLHYLKGRHSNL